jgi:AP-3 complex subunit beta
MVANDAIISIQLVLSKNLDWLPKIIPVLIKALPNLQRTGKQSVYWLLGEYACIHAKDFDLAADILRLAAQDYSKQAYSVKLQIMNFGMQIYASNFKQKQILRILIDYILSMAKFDNNIDVRDRARYFCKLLEMTNIDLHKLFTTHPTFTQDIITKDNNLYDFGTVSSFFGTKMNGYNQLPDFPKQNIEVYRGTRVSSLFNRKESRPASKTSNESNKIHNDSLKLPKEAAMTLEDFLSPDESDFTDEDWDTETQDSTDNETQNDQDIHFLRNSDESRTDPANTMPPTIPTPTNPSEG